MDEKLKGIVRKMIDNGETDADIDYIISEYNKKKSQAPSLADAPKSTNESENGLGKELPLESTSSSQSEGEKSNILQFKPSETPSYADVARTELADVPNATYRINGSDVSRADIIKHVENTPSETLAKQRIEVTNDQDLQNEFESNKKDKFSKVSGATELNKILATTLHDKNTSQLLANGAFWATDANGQADLLKKIDDVTNEETEKITSINVPFVEKKAIIDNLIAQKKSKLLDIEADAKKGMYSNELKGIKISDNEVLANAQAPTKQEIADLYAVQAHLAKGAKNEFSTISDKMRSDDGTILSAKDIKALAKNDGYNLLQATNPARYDQLRDWAENKTAVIPESVNYEMEQSGLNNALVAKGKTLNTLQAKAAMQESTDIEGYNKTVGEINQAKEEYDYLTKQFNENINNYPSLKQERDNREKIDVAFAFAKAQMPEVALANKFIMPFVGSVDNVFYTGVKKTMNTILKDTQNREIANESLTREAENRYYTGKDIQGNESKEVFDAEGNFVLNPYSFAYNAGQGLGTLGAMMVAGRLVAGVGGITAESSALARGASSVISTTLSSGLMGYDGHYAEAMNSLPYTGSIEDRRQKANEVAIFKTGIEVLSESMLSPDELFVKWFAKPKIEQNAIINAIQNAGKPLTVKNVFETAKIVTADWATESLWEEGLSAAGSYGVDVAYGSKEYQTKELFKETYEAAITAAVGMSPMLMMGAKKAIEERPMQNAYMYKAGLSPIETGDMIQAQANDKKITQEEANKLIAKVNEMAHIVDNAPTEKTNGEKYTEEEKIKYANLELRKRMVEAEKAKETNPVIQKQQQEKVDEINQTQADIVNGMYGDGTAEALAQYADDEIIDFTVNSINEVPEQFRDKAVKLNISGYTQKKILGVPYGAKTPIHRYKYSVTGKEAREIYGIKPSVDDNSQTFNNNPIGVVPNAPTVEVSLPQVEIDKINRSIGILDKEIESVEDETVKAELIQQREELNQKLNNGKSNTEQPTATNIDTEIPTNNGQVQGKAPQTETLGNKQGVGTETYSTIEEAESAKKQAIDLAIAESKDLGEFKEKEAQITAKFNTIIQDIKSNIAITNNTTTNEEAKGKEGVLETAIPDKVETANTPLVQGGVNAVANPQETEAKVEQTPTASDVEITDKTLGELVVNNESKQALKDIITIATESDFDSKEGFVRNGNWNGEGEFGFDSNGNVVLTRFAQDEDGLVKSGKITSPEDLKRLTGVFGGEQIATSGMVGGLTAFSTKNNGVTGTYRIPLEDFKNLLKEGYITFAGFGNSEFVLSPHIASKYLTEINGKAVESLLSKEQPTASDVESTAKAVVEIKNKTLNSKEGSINTGDIKVVKTIPNVDKVVGKDKNGNEIKVVVNGDKLKGTLLSKGGSYLFKAMQGRIFTLAKVGDFYLPFYISSAGTSGKIAGEWYPFFGYNNWLVKGRVGTKGEMEYSQKITAVQKILNDNFILPAKYLSADNKVAIGAQFVPAKDENGNIIREGKYNFEKMIPNENRKVLYDLSEDVDIITHHHQEQKGETKLNEHDWVAEKTGLNPKNVVNDGGNSADNWINNIIALTENVELASKGVIKSTKAVESLLSKEQTKSNESIDSYVEKNIANIIKTLAIKKECN
jgi:hypothetical protein